MYFSLVLLATSSGRPGAGGCFHWIDSRKSRTYCLSYDCCVRLRDIVHRPETGGVGSQNFVGQHQLFGDKPNSNLVSAMMMPFVRRNVLRGIDSRLRVAQFLSEFGTDGLDHYCRTRYFVVSGYRPSGAGVKIGSGSLLHSLQAFRKGNAADERRGCLISFQPEPE